MRILTSCLVSSLALASSLAFMPPPAAAQEQSTAPAESASADTGISEWDIASEDFSADPAVTFGVLPNGMRYAIRRNANPPGEAVIRFNVEVGGRDETGAEDGAAHFVEHMAFNGSENIPEGELLPILERLGLAFGADTNAETSLDYTTYKLDLPSTDEETVDTAFTVIREMAGRLTFDPEAVERERGIILREAQDRNDPNRRRAADYFNAALPNSPLGERIIADPERIRNITAEELKAFYQGYYRPERSTFVIVGDFDPEEIEAKVKATFGDWQGVGEARAAYNVPEIDRATPAFSSFVDPAIPEIIEIQTLSQWEPEDNSAASAREEALRAIAAAVLSNRINALSRSADSPTLGAQANEQPLFRTATSYGLLIVAKDGQWKPTLELAERELRRALQYGFTQSEVDEIKAGIETTLRNAAGQADGRTSISLAEALVSASLNEEVVTSPEANLAFYREIAPTITAKATSAAFARSFAGGVGVIHLSTKEPIEGGVPAIAQTLAASSQVPVTAPEEAEAVAFAYTDWGTPGEVVADEMIDDLGIRTILFANGVQLNIKRTDFEPGKVNFAMRVGEGASAFPSDKPGLRLVAPIFASVDGLKAHDPDELRRALAGRQVSLPLTANNAGLVSTGSTTSDDLLLQMQLLAARVTATAYRDETQAQLAGVAPVLVQNIRGAPIQLWSNAFNAVLSGGDTRLGIVDPASLADMNLSDLQAALEPQLSEGGISIGLVGDIDEAAAIAAVAATLGTLPERTPRTERSSTPRPISFATSDEPIMLTHAGEADQGVLSVSWPTDDGNNLADDIARDVLASILTLRMTETLREELGAAYSPTGLSYSTTTFEGFGHISAVVTGPADQMDQTAGLIAQIGSDLASEPVTQDLLQRAVGPIREGFERAESQNASWTSLVATAQSDPEALERRRQRMTVLDAITPEVIQETAARYLAPSLATQIRVVPEQPE